jgi:hypothetical protein
MGAVITLGRALCVGLACAGPAAFGRWIGRLWARIVVSCINFRKFI